MLHSSFNRNLHKLIKKVHWDMYLVNVNRNYTCTCLNTNSNSANPGCPKCLGTGHKVSIKKIKAIKQPYAANSKSGGGNNSLGGVYNKYFMESQNGPISIGDYIVHNNEIDSIKTYRTYRVDSSQEQYYEIFATLKRYNNKEFFNNFNKIVK